MHRRALLAVTLATPALAQPAWPRGPVRIVSPYTPAGASDATARFVAQHLQAAIGESVVVENRPGAGGNLGAELVARSAPDGQTLLIAAAAHAANVSVFRNMPYDLERDFAPIVVVMRVPNALSVNPSVPARDLAEFVAFAKRNPVAYGSAGVGTLPHLAMELLRQLAGFEAVHVPYRGSAPAITDLIGGRLQAVFENLPPQLPHLRAGTLRGLAIGLPERHPDLPDLPTIAETSGFAGFEATAWQSVLAPTGTPEPILRRVAGVVRAAIATPEGDAQIRRLGGLPSGLELDAFRALIRAEVATWAEVVRRGNITAD